jgi:hypothetical protein
MTPLHHEDSLVESPLSDAYEEIKAMEKYFNVVVCKGGGTVKKG